jgi:hypothetical protein
LPKKIELNGVGQFLNAIVFLGIAILLFVSWDTAGRNSFELLGVIHRLNVLPEYIPTRPILMLWVLLPVFLIWGIKGSVQRFLVRRGSEVVLHSRQIWMLPVLVSIALVSYIVTLAPISTSAPRWCLWFSIAGLFGVVWGFLPRGTEENETKSGSIPAGGAN